MKVCHLTSVHSYKDIRIFIKECSSLSKAGFEVHLVAPNAPTNILNGVHIHGVKTQSHHRIRRMTLLTKEVYKKALKIDAQIYHFHDPELIPVAKRLKKLGKKVIYDVHEDLPRAILSKSWIPKLLRYPISVASEFIENQSVNSFDMIMCATPFITQRFSKLHVNVININNFPLKKELLNARDDYKDFDERNFVSYIGGIGKIRGVEELLLTSNLLSGNTEIKLAGPVNDFYKNKIINSIKVEYMGILERDEVKNLLGKSSAGLVTFLPEPNHINAQPNKMFEYMSAGIPVICSNFPLWAQIIEKHQCGVCVNPTRPEEIASAINYLVKNPDVAETMGQNARRAVEIEYNWEKESIKLIEAYKNLLN